jgi:putative SOS response-associated peptidase YedK
MCGRAALSAPPDDLRELFGLDETPELAPRFNIAPTQPIPIVRERKPLDDAGAASSSSTPSARAPRGERRMHLVRWGLVPSSAPDLKNGARMINARVESLTTRGLFRDALVRRRCLVAVDGFYEWRAEGRAKRPFIVRMPNGAPFALAGLWDRWRAANGDAVDTCTVITTASLPPIDAIHDRMPIVLARERWDEWLDPRVRDPARLVALLGDPVRDLVLHEVGARVNNVANDDADCAAPIAPNAT